MMATQQPIIVLKEGTRRERGKSAQYSNIMAARAIADAVRSTLGPKGMDKMLVDSMGDVIITNDGATILKEIDVEHPAAKMMVEVAKAQDEECGDGTTTAVVLTGELLKVAGEMLEKNIHPTIISRGFKMASDKAVEILNSIAKPIKKDDTETLRNIAITAMASKGASAAKEMLADLVVKAVRMVAEEIDGKTFVDLDNIQITKKQGGSISDTQVIEGIILDKERVHEGMPKIVKNAKIALVNAPFEVKKTEVDARIQITDPSQLQKFLDEEEAMLRKMVEKVKSAGANVLICQKGIDDIAQHFLAKEGIYAVRRAKKSDMEKLAKATGAKIVSNLDDLTPKDLGKAGVVEERKIGDDRMTFVMNCKNPKAVSILVRGGTEHIVDELERALHDALSVVKVALEDGKITPGGGAAAAEIATRLREYAPTVGGREQMAIEAFADAIEIVPRTLAENAGLDPIDIMIKVRAAHKKGEKYAGIDVETGDIADMMKKNIIEPLRVSTQEVRSAAEAAIMILRIDDVIAAKSTEEKGKETGKPGGEEETEFD
ncbi:MAG TPA: thermosome subunit [Thermoplasmatales archaeon]|nr:thermosome subunit [Thermoplasmatales archaeon]HEX17296.1 thermosome subunit [Thermoplasmatales archaeon]